MTDKSFEQWVFEYGARLHGTTLEKAFDAGFAVTHIGGGALALRKDADDENSYWLITDSTYVGDDLDPEAADWMVGRYRPHEDSSQSAVVVEQRTTLNEALERHDLLPDPTHKADGATSYVQFETWEQVGPRTPSRSI
jgi:hypothetical protein